MMISHKWIWLVALIFFTKVLILSFWVTPLWDIPDETGHFAYARDIGSGKGIPVLGKSVIESDILSHVYGYEIKRNDLNWIAQHPPGYHIPAGLIWKVATFLTDDPEILFRAPRIFSAISGALTLVVLYFLLVLISGNCIASLGFAACAGFIPMFSNLSSGTNHDTTVTLFVSLTTYYWVKFLIRKSNIKYAYYFAIWLSVACFTKFTMLVVALPMVVFVLLELESPWKLRVKQSAIISAICIFLPGLWMLRSYYYYGKLVVISDTILRVFSHENNPLTDSFFYYLSKLRGIDLFFNYFFGLFGWLGTFKGKTIGIPVNSWPLGVYSLVVMLLLFVTAVYIINRIVSGNIKYSEKTGSIISIISRYLLILTNNKIVKLTMIGYGLLIALITLLVPTGSVFRQILFFLLAFVCIISLFLMFYKIEIKQRLIAYAWIICGFFCIVLLIEVYHFYLTDWQLTAIHGRYLYPLIPLMMLGIFFPAVEILKKQAQPVFVSLALVMGFTEINVYLSQVMPFYKSTGLIDQYLLIGLYAIFVFLTGYIWLKKFYFKNLKIFYSRR